MEPSISPPLDSESPSPDFGIRTGATRQVRNLLDRLEARLSISQFVNIGLALALILSAGAHVWTAYHPPQPQYFATTADGRIIPLIPISEPYVTHEILLEWASKAVIRAYTLDYVHWREQLNQMRPDFTDAGFLNHRGALESAGTLEAVTQRRLVSAVVTSAPPIIINQGVLADRYVWKLEIPIAIAYEGASKTSAPQRLIAEVLVVRVPTNQLARGIAIHQLITHVGG